MTKEEYAGPSRWSQFTEQERQIVEIALTSLFSKVGSPIPELTNELVNYRRALGDFETYERVKANIAKVAA